MDMSDTAKPSKARGIGNQIQGFVKRGSAGVVVA